MNRLATILVSFVAVAALAFGAYWFGQHVSPPREASFVVYPDYEGLEGRYVYPAGMKVVAEDDLEPAYLELWNRQYKGEECLRNQFHGFLANKGKIFVCEGRGVEIFEYYKNFPGRKGEIRGKFADTDDFKFRQLGALPYPYTEMYAPYMMAWNDTHTIVIGLGEMRKISVCAMPDTND